MTENKTKYHMVHYRHFAMEAEKLEEGTLESLCRAALNTQTGSSKLWARPQDRVFDIEGEESRKIFLNKVADLSSAVFGEMCLAQAKDLQALLKMEPTEKVLSDLTTATVYDLNESTAPEGSQFIRGLAYWIAIGNHFFFVKTSSMTPELIRLYIEWLLKERSRVIDGSTNFAFDAEFDKAVVGDDIEVRKLRVSGKSTTHVVSVPDEPSEKKIKKARRVAERKEKMTQAMPIVEAVLGKNNAKSLVESLGPSEYLTAEASVNVRGSWTEASRKKLQSIATDLADASDATVQIDGKYGTIKGDDAILRMKMPFSVHNEGSHLLEFDNVADQLQTVYSRFVEDGKIKA